MQAALRLARMGFRVFPLIPGDKKPAVRRFPIVATTDAEQITRWWTERPDYNIGISTTGFVVADIDTKKGPHALYNFYTLGGHFNTITVRTATGGYHVDYAGPDSRLAVDVVPGIDIRSHGGFVVGPGSITSSANEGCVDGEYTVANSALVAQIPGSIEIVLKPPNMARKRDDNAELDEPYNIENAKVWLHAAEPAVSGKGGNNATYKVCAKLVRDFALTEETAYQQLVTHWNHRCLPPWSPGELWQLVQHASAYGAGDLGTASPAAMFSQVVLVPAAPVVEQHIQTPYVFAPNGTHMGNAVLPALQTARPWKVDKLLMNGEVTVLGGMGAMGKSMFQLCCAAHFALGRDFGPYKLKVPGVPMRSVIYNGEDDTMEQSRRLLAICQHFNFDYYIVASSVALIDDRQGELLLAYRTQGNLQMNMQSVQFLMQATRDGDADLIFVDPLVNLHLLSENDNSEMRFVMKVLHNIARETNTALMVAHHTGKGSLQKDKGDVDAFRGAGALINSSRIAIIMSSITKLDREMFGIKEESTGEYIRIDTAKANMLPPHAGQAQAWLKWNVVRHISGDFIGVPAVADMKARKADRDTEIAVIIRDHIRMEGSGAITRTDAARAVVDSGHILSGLSESALRKIIQTLFDKPIHVGSDTLTLVKDGGKELIKLH